MPFELACTDYTFHALPHETALHLIRDLGVPYVDLLFFPGCNHVKPEEVLAGPAETAKKIGAKVEEAGLRVSHVRPLWGSYYHLTPNDPDPKVRSESRQNFARGLEFAQALGARGLTIIPGMAWAGESRASALDRAGEEMAWRAQQAASANVMLAYEPHYESITESVDEALRLVELAPGLRVTLDYSHLVYQGYSQPEIERLHPVTGHIDGRQAANGKMQSTAREGTLNFPRIIQEFIKQGFEGEFCLEYACDPYLGMDALDTITETVTLRNLFLRERDGAALETPTTFQW